MVDVIANRYVLVGETSRSGGQSVIRKASDTFTGDLVAVKLLVGGREELTNKIFERETTTLASLEHPNIIRLLDSGREDDGPFYLVLEWREQSLLDLLEEGRFYDWEELFDTVADPLISALSYAHLKGVEHRDIKPGNVLIDPNGRPVLADFGIAKLRIDVGVSEYTVAHFRSKPYAPPEDDTSIPFVRDVYSMGVLLLQALSREPLRDFADVQPAVEAVRVPTSVRKLLQRCISPDRSERPLNGSLLLKDLREAVNTVRAVSVQNTRKIPLQLISKVRKIVESSPGSDDSSSAEMVVNRDLASDVHTSFGIDPESKGTDLTTVILIGNSWRWVLKKQASGHGFVIISGRLHEYEHLEAIRQRAMRLSNSISWTCNRSQNSATLRSTESFLAELENWDDQRYVSAHVDNDSDVYDRWLQLLQAIEDVERGQLRPLRYEQLKTSGRETEFVLSETIGEELVGETREVMVQETGRFLSRGEVISQDANRLTIRFPKRRPSFPDRGVLSPHIGPTQLAIQRQRDAVAAIQEGRAAKPQVRELILDPSTAVKPNEIDVSEWSANLDVSKQSAVKAALGASDITVVEGPPGTGKTTFITELVTQHLRRNNDARILIVSQTHVAVDNSLERLENAGVEGCVRLGTVDDPRVDPAVRHLLLEPQMRNWAAQVRKRAAEYVDGQARKLHLSSDHLHAALALTELIQVKNKITVTERKIEEARPERATNRQEERADAADAAALQAQIDKLSEQQVELVDLAQKHLSGYLTLSTEISIEDAETAVELLAGETAPARELLEILALQTEWLLRVASDENLASAFLQSTNVIAGTCLGFLRHPSVRDLEIDLCIVDEASKATATEVLVPMARSKKWVLIGDTNQLPPIEEEVLRSPSLMSEHELSPEFVKETLFQRLVSSLPDHSRHLLSEQYRMVRPIGDLISSCFYHGDLRSPREDGLPGYHLLGKTVLWLDTEKLGSQRREESSGGGEKSRANRTEARIMLKRLRRIDLAIEKGFIEPPNAGLSVLLIAPYRSQVDELSRRLHGVKVRNLNVQVQSVDAVQGREADIVLFSVTRSNTTGSMGFLGDEYWRRINVALSRARFGLTIVGDAGFCRDSPGALRQVLKYIESNPDDCERVAATDD